VSDARPAIKILHIDPEEAWGGGEYQVLGLVTSLSARGHENHLLCHPQGALNRAAKARGILTFPIRVRNDLDFRPVLALRRLIRREGYEIVHFHTKRAHALSLFLGRVTPALRYVVTRRMDYPVKRSWYTRRLYNEKVDGVIAISHKIAAVLGEGGVQGEKIRVIHSGIDPAPFQRASAQGAESAGPVVGTVAVLEERKGHRFLLEAAALLKGQGYRLRYRLAGEGSRRSFLEKRARELGLAEEVAFLGFVGDVPGFLSTVDIFVLPSLYEGLGIAVLEAMAAGRPVVASRTGGIPELVADQVTGLLVPPRDFRALARAIAHLISQNGTLQKMGENGREKVIKEFTVEQMARKNEDFYYELLEASSGKRLR
jgi:glycosyltransferase involved in cell wall biosynthesis